jgi:hypothetical protein
MGLQTVKFALSSLLLLKSVFGQTESVEWGLDSPVLTIPGVFNIETENNGFNVEGFQLSEAFKCAINQVNNASILPNLPVVWDLRDAGGKATEATKAGQAFVNDDYLYPFVVTAAGKEGINALNIAVQDSAVSLMSYYTPGTKLDAEPTYIYQLAYI